MTTTILTCRRCGCGQGTLRRTGYKWEQDSHYEHMDRARCDATIRAIAAQKQQEERIAQGLEGEMIKREGDV